MLDSGIIDGRQLRPIHLWPNGRLRQPPKTVKVKFLTGKTFLASKGLPDEKRLTIHDLPPGARVVLHCLIGTRLQMTVPIS